MTMDYTQRLKWIENVFNGERVAFTPTLPVDRITENDSSSNAAVRLPVKHVALFRPEHYESGYAYPLVIWLHPDGGSEQDLHEIMPQISIRNYLGLSFRAPAIDPAAPSNGYRWPDSHLFVKQFSSQIRKTVHELQKVLNIHERRVYLAGTGSACSVATKLLIQAPHFFAGAALVNGQFSKTDFQSESSCKLKGNRILLDQNITDTTGSPISSQWVTRMWETTGAETHLVNSLQPKLNNQSDLLPFLNRWIMEGISTARLV